MFRIVRRQTLTPTTFLWEVEAPDVAAAARPGQFVMVRLHDGSERVPLTIADFDADRGTVTIVVQALGRSTLEMRDRYHEGDMFADFVGPLGGLPHPRRAASPRRGGGGPTGCRLAPNPGWRPVLAEAEKLRFPVTPKTGAEALKVIEAIYAAPPDLVKEAREIAGG